MRHSVPATTATPESMLAVSCHVGALKVLCGAVVLVLACTDAVQPGDSDDPLLPPASRVVAVAAGFSSSCALTQTGRMYCWGENRFGELGDSSRTVRPAPVPVQSESTFTFLAGTQGTSRTCAITRSGAAYCWGYNLNGEVGDGSVTDRWVPTLVSGGISFANISTSYHTCGVDRGGASYCWGPDLSGALGRGSPPYGDITRPGRVATTTRFTVVTTGLQFSCALDAFGHAYCWGWAAMAGAGGRLDTVYNVPVAVQTALRFVSLSAAEDHTCGVTSDGAAYCWGGVDGVFGDIVNTPRRIPAIPKVRQVVGGRLSSCVLTTEGRALCAARGDTLQMVADSIRFAGLSVGSGHACGFTQGGAVYCWGEYWSAGQLGDGTLQRPPTPLTAVRVVFPRLPPG